MENFRFIRAGSLVDGSGGLIREDIRLCLSKGRVNEIRSFASENPKPEEVLDLSGYTLLPGLVDAHLHLFMSGTADLDVRKRQLNADFEAMKPIISGHVNRLIAAGVVAARDGGDYGGYASRYRSESLETAPAPFRLRVAGKAWRKPGRYGRLIGRPPREGESLAEAISRTAAGIDHVKIVNSGLNSLSDFGKETPPQFDSPELREGVRAAHARGLKVMVHCNGTLPVRVSIEAGCDSIEHGFFMGRDNLKRMADRGTVWVPTAITMKAYSETLEPGSPEADISRRNFEHQLEQIRLAREMGVSIAVGTDAGSLGVHHGSAVRQELKILMEAGYPLTEAIRCGTANGAELLGLDGSGIIERGASADFIAVRGRPEDLPDSLASIRLFISGGEYPLEAGNAL